MPIDRCYCYQVTFAALQDVADRTGVTSVEALQAHVTFGENCELCHPYVERMLATGQTSFEELLRAENKASDG